MGNSLNILSTCLPQPPQQQQDTGTAKQNATTKVQQDNTEWEDFGEDVFEDDKDNNKSATNTESKENNLEDKSITTSTSTSSSTTVSQHATSMSLTNSSSTVKSPTASTPSSKEPKITEPPKEEKDFFSDMQPVYIAPTKIEPVQSSKRLKLEDDTQVDEGSGWDEI